MSLEDKIDAISVKVDRADRELFGNGRPGLTERVATVQATQKLTLKVLGAIGVAGLGLLGGILLTLL